MNSLCSSEHFK